MQQSGNAIILNGIGGMGKSELLNYWLNKNATAHYDSILYFHCGDGVLPALLARQTLLMKELGLTPEQFNAPNIIDCVCDALMPYKKLLLVLDNLPWAEPAYQENVNLFAKFLSVSNAHIIATSRRGYTQYKTIPIGKLKEGKAIELFKNHHKNSNASDDAIRDIIQRVGGHTLMIELLAKTASEYDWTAESLLEKLKDKDFDYSKLKTGPVEFTQNNENQTKTPQQALLQLFDLSLFGDNPDNQAYRDILFHLSCLSSQPFTSKAVTNWLDIDTPSIKKLVKLGWIQAKDSEQYYLHESITHAVKLRFDELPSDERLALMLTVSARMEADYQAQDHSTLNTACLQAIASYLEAQNIASLVVTEFEQIITVVRLFVFVKFCREKGLYSIALKMLQKQFATITKIIGTLPEYASVLNSLALLHQSVGNYNAALPLFKQAVAISKKVGDESLDYASALANLGNFYQITGDYEASLTLLKHAVVIRKKAGDVGLDYATTLGSLGNVYLAACEYEAALPLYQQDLEITKNILGEGHSDYFAVLTNVALLYKKMGNLEESLDLYQRALNIAKINLGREHPSYATCLCNLASLHQSIGNHKTALSMYQQALTIRKENLDENHPDYALNLNNIANCLYEMHNYELALPMLKKAITILEKSLGNEHPNTKAAQANYEAAKKHASDD